MKKSLTFILLISLFLNVNAQENEIQNLELKIDSLQNELDSCRMSSIFQSNFPFKLTKISGKFTEVGRGDCLHIMFKETERKIWDFGSTNNSVPFDLWFYNDLTDSFSLSKEVKGKEFTLIIADLIAIRCNSADSYDEGNHHYIKMPTILEMYETER